MNLLVRLILISALFSAICLAQPGATVELPMRLVNGMPAVEVFVNGQGPFLFRIDTGGAGQARVDIALAEKLKLPSVGEARGSDGSSNAVTMQIVRLDALKLGTVEFKNVEALSRNYNQREGERIDGILCFGLFAEHLFTLDYPALKVKLSSGALPASDGQRILPFTSANGIPSIKFDLAGTTTEAHIDSGNMVAGFMFSEEQTAKLKFAAPPNVVGRARTVSREFEIKEGVLEGNIQLGAYRFPKPLIRFAEVFPRNNIGAVVLREFALTFDQKHQRVRWERAGEVVQLAAPPRPTPAVATLAPTEAQSYLGVYGQRTITFADGQLYLQRAGGPRLALVKLGPDEFGLAEVPEARIQFVKDTTGKVTELRVRNRQGDWETSAKTP